MHNKVDNNNFSKVLEVLKNENSFFLIKNLKDLINFHQELPTLYSYILVEGFKNFKDEDNKSKTIRFIMEDINKLNFSDNIKKNLYYKFLIYTIKDMKYGKFENYNRILDNFENFSEKEKTEFYSEVILSLKHLETYEVKTIIGRLQNEMSKFSNTENVNTINNYILDYYVKYLEKNHNNTNTFIYKNQEQNAQLSKEASFLEVFNNLNRKMNNFLNAKNGILNNYNCCL